MNPNLILPKLAMSADGDHCLYIVRRLSETAIQAPARRPHSSRRGQYLPWPPPAPEARLSAVHRPWLKRSLWD